MSSNAVLAAKRCLLSSLTRVLRTNLFGKFFRKFHSASVHAPAKRVGALFNTVSAILRLASQFKVRRIATPSIVSARAFVQHKLSFWNWAFVQHVAHDMCSNRHIHSAIQHAVTVMSGTCPQPTSNGAAGFIHLRPEPFWNRWGKSLRIEVVEDNFWLCSIHRLLCRFRAVTGRAGTPFTLSVCPS